MQNVVTVIGKNGKIIFSTESKEQSEKICVDLKEIVKTHVENFEQRKKIYRESRAK